MNRYLVALGLACAPACLCAQPISQLPRVTVLGPADLLPVTQGNTTKSATVQQMLNALAASDIMRALGLPGGVASAPALAALAAQVGSMPQITVDANGLHVTVGGKTQNYAPTTVSTTTGSSGPVPQPVTIAGQSLTINGIAVTITPAS